jgi:hypothetical protein
MHTLQRFRQFNPAERPAQQLDLVVAVAAHDLDGLFVHPFEQEKLDF